MAFTGYKIPNTLGSALKKNKQTQAWGGSQIYNPAQDPTYKIYKQANDTAGDQLARRTSNSTMASLSAMSGGMPNSYSVGAATQAGAQAAQPFYQRSVDYLPQVEQNNYNRGIDKLNRQDNINNQLGIVNPWGDVQITNPNVYKSSNDYMAKINEIQSNSDTTDDALLPQYYAARMEKMLTDPAKYASGLSPYKTVSAKAQDLQNEGQAMQNKYYPQIQESTLQNQNLQNKYYGPQAEANLAQTKAQTSNIYADNARQNQASSKYERIGPLYSQMMQSGDPSSWLAKNASIMSGDELDALLNYAPKQGKTDYKTNPNFSDELKNISKNKDDFYKILSNDPQSFINEYGWEGYQELYQRSKPTTSGIQYGLYNIATP